VVVARRPVYYRDFTVAEEAVVRIILRESGSPVGPGSVDPTRQWSSRTEPVRPPRGEPTYPPKPSVGKPSEFIDQLSALFGKLKGAISPLAAAAGDAAMALYRLPKASAHSGIPQATRYTPTLERAEIPTLERAGPPKPPDPKLFEFDATTGKPLISDQPKIPTLERAGPAKPVTPNFPAAEAVGAEGMSLAALAGPVAIAFAVLEALKKIREGLMAGVRAVGDFSQALITADTNVGNQLEKAGEGYKAFSEKLFYLSPLAGILHGVIAETITSFAKLTKEVDANVTRYAEYNPQLALAQGMAEARQQLGDLRRAQEVGPALARYVDAQSRLQQHYEDIKVRILEKMLPSIEGAVVALDKLVPVGSRMLDVTAKTLPLISPGLGTIVALLEWLANQQQEAQLNPFDIGFVMPPRNEGGFENPD
jgi:hypothetical protein